MDEKLEKLERLERLRRKKREYWRTHKGSNTRLQRTERFLETVDWVQFRKTLSEIDLKIFQYYYGLDGFPKLSQKETGDKLGLSRQWVNSRLNRRNR